MPKLRQGSGPYLNYPTNFDPSKNSLFFEGNQFASRKNMSPESHARRMAGLAKAWDYRRRISEGENLVTYHQAKAKRRSTRVRIRENVEREVREVQARARRAADDVMKRMEDIVNSKMSKDSDAIAAGQLLLDRAYGKSSQTNINANIDANGKQNEVSGTELDTRVAETLRRIEEITGGTPGPKPSPERPSNIRKLDRDPNGSSVH